ncbi:MAG: methyltransferase FkbM family [Bacteroidetes bacterium]|jgi:FkbM family methyltransferase|nr:methyltransferase FkbM family [Bacteroidota bacterium]MDF2452262.1 methyltransferase FkbM family [Bacteroidota bacterium]
MVSMIKNSGKKLIQLFINNILLKKSSIPILNSIYESAPSWLINYIWGHTRQPAFNFNWRIKLLNSKKVYVPVSPDDVKTWEFALSYKWSDKCLTIAEAIVNDFYPLNHHYFDIGANMGLRSLYPLSIKRPVILFEPNSKLKIFSENVFMANGFSSYKFETLCLSDKTGEVEFYVSPSSYMSSIFKENAEMDKASGSVETIQVQSITLDEYIGNNNSLSPKIIKIDTEGNELSILRGGTNTFDEFSPVILTEILPHNPEGVTIFNYLTEKKYTCYALSDYQNFSKIIKVKNNSELDFNKVNNYLFVKNKELEKIIDVKSTQLN